MLEVFPCVEVTIHVGSHSDDEEMQSDGDNHDACGGDDVDDGDDDVDDGVDADDAPNPDTMAEDDD